MPKLITLSGLKKYVGKPISYRHGDKLTTGILAFYDESPMILARSSFLFDENNNLKKDVILPLNIELKNNYVVKLYNCKNNMSIEYKISI
jgi:hypothetical protein